MPTQKQVQRLIERVGFPTQIGMTEEDMDENPYGPHGRWSFTPVSDRVDTSLQIARNIDPGGQVAEQIELFQSTLQGLNDRDLETLLDHTWPSVRSAAESEAARRWAKGRNMDRGM